MRSIRFNSFQLVLIWNKKTKHMTKAYSLLKISLVLNMNNIVLKYNFSLKLFFLTIVNTSKNQQLIIHVLKIIRLNYKTKLKLSLFCFIKQTCCCLEVLLIPCTKKSTVLGFLMPRILQLSFLLRKPTRHQEFPWSMAFLWCHKYKVLFSKLFKKTTFNIFDIDIFRDFLPK